jgi:hypothetical protein
MEALVTRLLASVHLIISGIPVALSSFSEDIQERIVRMAMHCCLNGPVGVKKDTVFPTIPGRTSIFATANCTNSSWRAFCLEVARVLKAKLENMPNCNASRLIQDYWPLVEWPEKAEDV